MHRYSAEVRRVSWRSRGNDRVDSPRTHAGKRIALLWRMCGMEAALLVPIDSIAGFSLHSKDRVDGPGRVS